MPPADYLLFIPVALLPALMFLLALESLDSFRLVSLRRALRVVVAGVLLALLAYCANSFILAMTGLSFQEYSRFVAPLVEELLKAAAMIILFARARIGFLIDAAIIGFAIGVGFALGENVYYLHIFPDANLGTWIVRGFGTTMMHGGATAIFGVLAQSWTERHTKFEPALYVPGLAAAIGLHAMFNVLAHAPLVATAGMLLLVPAILLLVFAKSEHRIHDWLLQDHADHQRLLGTMSIEFAHSEAGRFVSEIADKFEGAHAAEIYAYMRLHAELVLRAEELLLAREAGAATSVNESDRDGFRRLHQLEQKIGKTAMLALWPHLHYSRKELAELYALESRVT